MRNERFDPDKGNCQVRTDPTRFKDCCILGEDGPGEGVLLWTSISGVAVRFTNLLA
jgi:hypothetical protein